MKEIAFGLDLGGTSLKYGLVTRAGEILAQGSVPTGREGRMAGIRAALVRRHRPAPAPRAGARRRRPGRRGRVRRQRRRPPRKDLHASPNLPFMKGFELGAFVRRESGLPTVAENDGSVAALAEFRLGAGRGYDSLLMATVGTGLGGGLVIGGELIRGRWGTAGEIGHGVFQPGGLKCGCGSRGCLEQYTASLALKRYYREAGGRAVHRGSGCASGTSSTRRRPAGPSRARRSPRSLATSESGSRRAPRSCLSTSSRSAAARASSDPCSLRPARAAFDAHALPGVRKSVRIVRAQLGNHAGLIGAALLAFDLLAPGRKRRTPGVEASRRGNRVLLRNGNVARASVRSDRLTPGFPATPSGACTMRMRTTALGLALLPLAAMVLTNVSFGQC